MCVLSGKVASILKYAKCLIHIDLCPVAIHRFEKSVNKKKDKLIKKNIVHNTVGDPMKRIDSSDSAPVQPRAPDPSCLNYQLQILNPSAQSGVVLPTLTAAATPQGPGDEFDPTSHLNLQ